MAIQRECKDVALLEKSGEIVIVRLRNDVRLLRKRGKMAIVRARKRGQVNGEKVGNSLK